MRCNLSVLVARERSSASQTFLGDNESTERPEAIDAGEFTLTHERSASPASEIFLTLPQPSEHEEPRFAARLTPTMVEGSLGGEAGSRVTPTTFEAGIEALASLHLKWGLTRELPAPRCARKSEDWQGAGGRGQCQRDDRDGG